MTQPATVAYLLDVDTTLLDNDRIVADLKRQLAQAFGAECQKRYWTIFEERRTQLGYSDYPGALQRYRDDNPRDPHLSRDIFRPAGRCWWTIVVRQAEVQIRE